ncbi:acyl-CoA/acyl-ACP dehydrogenase [Nocardioides sp. zg-ZUI104]|uniref:acyl-CoA dehydrogenase family protein n=1 Tax=Nocardioides faecalis TaxID=2803858 RepID=UPI001BCE6613|nr:acyl-CoA dehydrogenase family protein [Nocardioides faecalis]MBS4754568.1 acyl-CoA/acyl-ACP dehydrogenase [Nocardioides faecalis]
MDQDELAGFRTSIARFLDRHAPVQATREVADGQPFDVATWQRMCTELDLLALAVPEERGGAGAGFKSLGAFAEELGRVLYAGPWLASGILGTRLLASLAPDDLREEHLPSLLAGKVVATLAVHETPTSVLEPSVQGSSTTARRTASGWSLTGSKVMVPDLGFADLVLVTAVEETDQTPGLYLVATSAEGVVRSQYPGADLSRRFGSLTLTKAPAILVASGETLGREICHHLDLARILQAAESAGAATAALHMGLDYARIREQFGRSIGSFQGVKHKYADLFRDIESARHVTRAALTAADTADPEDLRLAASISAVRSADAFVTAAKEIIHLHGGIGYTWEHDAHLFYRRALHNRAASGHPSLHRERIAELIGL